MGLFSKSHFCFCWLFATAPAVVAIFVKRRVTGVEVLFVKSVLSNAQGIPVLTKSKRAGKPLNHKGFWAVFVFFFTMEKDCDTISLPHKSNILA